MYSNSSPRTNANGSISIDWKASLLLVWFFRTLVPKWIAIESSLVDACIATKTPGTSEVEAKRTAPRRFRAESEEGDQKTFESRRKRQARLFLEEQNSKRQRECLRYQFQT